MQTCKPGSVPLAMLRAPIIYLPGPLLTRSSSLPLATTEEPERAVLYPGVPGNRDIFGLTTHEKYG
jgi:hypothetical protein